MFAAGSTAPQRSLTTRVRDGEPGFRGYPRGYELFFGAVGGRSRRNGRGAMTEAPTNGSVDRPAYWDDRYRTIGASAVSWYEDTPTTSLDLITRTAADTSTSIIDIGGGASALSGQLQRLGFDDVTVLDVSESALETARLLVDRPDDVTWIRTDLLEWSPARRWGVWHDRAVFHFLTDPAERDAYRGLIAQSVEPGGAIVMATFAPDGPTSCSGLVVRRYDADQLLAELGPGWTELARRRVEHRTPSGAVQPFTWIVARRMADAKVTADG